MAKRLVHIPEERLVHIPEELDQRLAKAVRPGEIDSFIAVQIKRGLDDSARHSLDSAIFHIADNDAALLDRLGNAERPTRSRWHR